MDPRILWSAVARRGLHQTLLSHSERAKYHATHLLNAIITYIGFHSCFCSRYNLWTPVMGAATQLWYINSCKWNVWCSFQAPFPIRSATLCKVILAYYPFHGFASCLRNWHFGRLAFTLTQEGFIFVRSAVEPCQNTFFIFSEEVWPYLWQKEWLEAIGGLSRGTWRKNNRFLHFDLLYLCMKHGKECFSWCLQQANSVKLKVFMPNMPSWTWFDLESVSSIRWHWETQRHMMYQWDIFHDSLLLQAFALSRSLQSRCNMTSLPTFLPASRVVKDSVDKNKQTSFR